MDIVRREFVSCEERGKTRQQKSKHPLNDDVRTMSVVGKVGKERKKEVNQSGR